MRTFMRGTERTPCRLSTTCSESALITPRRCSTQLPFEFLVDSGRQRSRCCERPRELTPRRPRDGSCLGKYFGLSVTFKVPNRRFNSQCAHHITSFNPCACSLNSRYSEGRLRRTD